MNQASVTELSVDEARLSDLVASILKTASAAGASEAEAAVSVDAGLSVTARMGEVETLEYQRDRGLGVTVYFGKRKGSASTADISDAAVRETVEKACSIARYTAEDPCSGLADAAQMASDPPDLDLSHPWDVTAEQAIELAIACEAEALGFDERIDNSEGASVGTHAALQFYGNSHGFVGGYRSTSHSLSCAVLARDQDGMQRDFWYSAARNPTGLDAATDVGRKAARRTVSRLGSRKIATTKAPVIYPAELARGLIAYALSAVSGTSQYRQSSFLLGAAGQTIFPDFVSLSERPHIPGGMGSAPFDNEGVATRDRELVADGVLGGYILGSYSARKLGLETTGNAGGVHNILVSHSDKALDDLLAEMGTGFLVAELMGQGVNPVTGDYSRGAAGYWVENGEIAYPVHEVTIAGNLKDMYKGIVAIGNDVDTRGKVRCGSILVDQMTIAGD